jgi:hypothetical protein
MGIGLVIVGAISVFEGGVRKWERQQECEAVKSRMARSNVGFVCKVREQNEHGAALV